MDRSTMNGEGPGNPGAKSVEDGGHGQAALLLVESLMHDLVNKGILSRRDFIEIVDGAAEVEHELGIAHAKSPSDSLGSHLYPLAAAFRKELGG